MAAAPPLDPDIRVGRCESLMLRVRERCYGSKFASDVFDLRPVRFLRARTPRHVRKCNRHIVDVSVKHLAEMPQRTGFRHQLIAVACSVDHHAKQDIRQPQIPCRPIGFDPLRASDWQFGCRKLQ
jgi:hypothetical protein